jgi:hypothetical protein
MQRAKVATESIRKVEDSGRVGRACSVFPLVISAPEEIRSPNLLIRRHMPIARPATIRVLMSCRRRCREARLLSSLSSGLSSAHAGKQRHSHRLLIPGDPALTIGCVKGGEAIVTSKTPFIQPIRKSDTAE